VRVALIDSNTYEYAVPRNGTQAAMEQAALGVIDAYTAEIRKLGDTKVQLVVLPENMAQIADQWHEAARVRLAAAADGTGATVIGGFNAMRDGSRRNMVWAFAPGASNPMSYEKRHLVPGLESQAFTPGPGPQMLQGGVEPEICFDMDFPQMLRHDATTLKPSVFAVPASEVGTRGNWSSLAPAADDWFHARDAVLRSVENSVPMARTAGRGLLTLSDRYGRVVAKARTSGNFTTLVGDLPLDGPGGSTLYDRIGDAFGWLCLALGAGLLTVSSGLGARAGLVRATPLS